MAEGSVSALDIRDIDVRGIDFKNVLAKTGETITEAVFSVEPAAGLTFDPSTVEVAGKVASVVLEGGVIGEYVVTCEIETSIGRRINRSFDVSVLDR